MTSVIHDLVKVSELCISSHLVMASTELGQRELASGLQKLTFGDVFSQSLYNAMLSGLQQLTFDLDLHQSLENVSLMGVSISTN